MIDTSMTTINSIVETLNEGLISPIEALMWLDKFNVAAQHETAYLVMMSIIEELNERECKEMDNVYSPRQD